MKRLLPAVAIVAFLILPQAVQAQLYDAEQLTKVEKIFVVVDDDVADGCLPSPNLLKVEAELILRQSDITVIDDLSDTDDPFGPHFLSIWARGAAVSGGSPPSCVAAISVSILRKASLIDGTYANVEVGRTMGVFLQPRSRFQNRLRTEINERVTELANEILKARGQ